MSFDISSKLKLNRCEACRARVIFCISEEWRGRVTRDKSGVNNNKKEQKKTKAVTLARMTRARMTRACFRLAGNTKETI